MSYPYFFIDDPEQISGDIIYLRGKDNNHLVNVLRAKTKDKVVVSGNRSIYECKIDRIGSKETRLKIFDVKPVEEKPYSITLFQAVLKKGPMEFVIQKTTEIGVDHIIPVITDRVLADPKKTIQKITRWRTIAYEASKQSKRHSVPSVEDLIRINDIDTSLFDIFFIPVEQKGMDNTALSQLVGILGGPSVKRLAYMIGPEGGFEKEEISFLANSARTLNLGSNIFRSETASVYFLSLLDYLLKTRNK